VSLHSIQERHLDTSYNINNLIQ